MPDILSHLLCARESTKYLSSEITDVLEANKSIFNMGAQGPDIFFFYRLYPWQKHKNVGEYAKLIHSNSPNEFFINAAKLLMEDISVADIDFFESKNKTSELHQKFSYLAGFLSHYALDTTCHPYIYYHSGIQGSHNHKYLECIIDTMLSSIYDVKKVELSKTYKAIALEEYERSVTSIYLSKIINRTFHVNLSPSIIMTSMKDMRNIVATMYDPLSIKRTVFSAIERTLNLKGKLVTAAFPAKLNSDIDYLNLNHSEWCHPCDDKIIYTSSFIDLFQDSVSLSYNLIMNLSFYLINYITADTLRIIIGNNLYNTGLDESLDQQMKFDNPIVDYINDFKL